VASVMGLVLSKRRAAGSHQQPQMSLDDAYIGQL